METKEIKSLLHQSIENIDDNDFLDAIKNFIENSYHFSEEPVLSEYQKLRIEESKGQIKKGEYFTNEHADRLVSEWLKR